MKKTIIAMCMIFVVMASLGFAVAGSKDNVQKQNKFILPKNAMEVSPGVFYLGKALDKGRVVEGYAFMIKDSQDKKARISKPPKEDPCYTFLAEGAKWKSVEPYIVDTANGRGLTDSFISDNLASDILKWETASGGYDILGDGKTGDVDASTIGQLNDKNEVMFGDIDSSGAIGVTIVWGIFSGPAKRRVLVEWDMIFDDVDFDWSEDATNSITEMDFENIATHELGHAMGMGDLYNTECNTQTMYGISWNGDIEKRSLESGDIAGINILY
ncbi:MAG: matrixin family metalloprotease [Nanoarchaeota archaeon]|nr:matrixin family metalloprotease [Nanoarchaeota archaeon]